jgi:hypothetical protein
MFTYYMNYCASSYLYSWTRTFVVDDDDDDDDNDEFVTCIVLVL